MAPAFLQRLFADSPSARDVLRSRHPGGQERYGFWSPELKEARKGWLKFVLSTFLAITLVMFAMLSVYFGSYYEQIPRATWFSVEVLDLDSAASPYGSVQHPAILGPAMQQAIGNSKQSEPHLGWYFADDNTLQQFRLQQGGQGIVPYDYAVQRVLNQDVWAVLVINANATRGAWAAIESGSEWDPQGAMTFVYEDARNFYANEQYVARLAPQVMLNGANAASNELTLQVLQLGNGNVLSTAPQNTVTGAFRYNLHNLRPFDMLAGIPATTVGTIYLIIFTFLISVLWNNQGLPLIQNSLTLPSEVLIKVFVPFVAYFWLSLNYSLVSYAFQVRFDRYFGHGGFVIYWMASWITMNALGFVMETVFLWAGPFFPFFLVFWVIINVSVAFLSIADMSPFYRYGYILPVWNLVDASKCIIFATKNHLAQNFAVNLGWMIVWMILLAVTVIMQRRKKEREALQKKWKEMKERDLDITEKEARERGESHLRTKDGEERTGQ